MKIAYGIALIMVSLVHYSVSADYQNMSDAKNKIAKAFNEYFPVPKENNFFNTNVFTQPNFYQVEMRDEFKKIGDYIKVRLDTTTLGVSVSQNNQDIINKAWLGISDALNTLINTISASRAMNKITPGAVILEKNFFNNLNTNQLSDMLATLEKRSKDLPQIKNNLKIAWNDFAQTKEIKEILSLIVMCLEQSYRTVINAGKLILKKPA